MITRITRITRITDVTRGSCKRRDNGQNDVNTSTPVEIQKSRGTKLMFSKLNQVVRPQKRKNSKEMALVNGLQNREHWIMKPVLDSQTILLFQLVKKREKQSVVKIVGVWSKKTYF